MTVLVGIPDSPLAFDYLGTVLLLLLILALLAGVGNLLNRIANWPRSPHHEHILGHRLHEFLSHWHH